MAEKCGPIWSINCLQGALVFLTPLSKLRHLDMHIDECDAPLDETIMAIIHLLVLGTYALSRFWNEIAEKWPQVMQTILEDCQSANIIQHTHNKLSGSDFVCTYRNQGDFQLWDYFARQF